MTKSTQEDRSFLLESVVGDTIPHETDESLNSTDEQHHQQQQQQQQQISPDLSLPLRILFGLNGSTLALPTTALMYIINTRVEMSLTLIPTYAATAFLPFSLKPLYAYLSSFLGSRSSSSSSTPTRHVIIAALLVASGISTALTALIPTGGVLACFLLAFLRGVTAAWPEFLLGLTLIDQARLSPASDYAPVAGKFQAQAATARNLGSVVAHAAALGFFALWRRSDASGKVLSDGSVTVLLVTAGLLNGVAAMVAFYFRVGARQTQPTGVQHQEILPRRPSYDSVSDSSDDSLDADCESPCHSIHDAPLPSAPPPSVSNSNNNVRLVIALQLVIILFSLRGPIQGVSSDLCWDVLATIAVMVLITTGWSSVSLKWERSHRVGLFLILRHALPSATYVMSSYFYSLFATAPAFLQVASLVDNSVTTLASWSYGRLFSRYSQGNALHAVIAGTTLLAAITSLLNLVFVQYEYWHADWMTKAVVAIVIKSIMAWTGEWFFLPDVILATVAAVPAEFSQPPSSSLELPTTRTDGRQLETETAAEPAVATRTTREGPQQVLLISREDDSRNVDIQYGALISCIDFGDQLGALLAGPLVAALGITRENDWDGMNTLIQLSCLFGLLSIGFLAVLR